MTGRPRTIWLVAGEDSGDQLGAKLMRALREAAPDVVFGGVGGEAMAEAGFASLFPLDDVAVMGYLPVLARARTLLRRIRETVSAAVDARPDVLVIIDSPGFTHAVARRVRKVAPASRSSITCRRASGRGGPGGRRGCDRSSTTSWPCCPSSRTRICGSAGRPAPMSDTR